MPFAVKRKCCCTPGIACACCLPPGFNCVEMTQAACIASGGEWLGPCDIPNYTPTQHCHDPVTNPTGVVCLPCGLCTGATQPGTGVTISFNGGIQPCQYLGCAFPPVVGPDPCVESPVISFQQAAVISALGSSYFCIGGTNCHWVSDFILIDDTGFPPGIPLCPALNPILHRNTVFAQATVDIFNINGGFRWHVQFNISIGIGPDAGPHTPGPILVVFGYRGPIIGQASPLNCSGGTNLTMYFGGAMAVACTPQQAQEGAQTCAVINNGPRYISPNGATATVMP